MAMNGLVGVAHAHLPLDRMPAFTAALKNGQPVGEFYSV
jgi:hypothetical protein